MFGGWYSAIKRWKKKEKEREHEEELKEQKEKEKKLAAFKAKEEEIRRKQAQRDERNARRLQQAKEETENEEWLYDCILQYLICPLWKCPVGQFLDENCIYFEGDDLQHNTIKVYDKFKSLVEGLLGQIIEEMKISEDVFLATVERGLKSKELLHRRIFEQLTLLDNFEAFAKLMARRNKELEAEAVHLVEKEDRARAKEAAAHRNPQRDPSPINMERDQLMKDKKELERVLGAKLKTQNGKKKSVEDEEHEEIENAMKMSIQEFEEKERLRKIEEERMIADAMRESGRRLLESSPKLDNEEAAIKRQVDLEEQAPTVNRETEEQLALIRNELQQQQQSQKDNKANVSKYDGKTVEELVEERENLYRKLQELDNKRGAELPEKAAPKTKESPEERRRRLKAQRDLMLRKRREASEQEMHEYQVRIGMIEKEDKEEEARKQLKKKLSPEEQRALDERNEIFNKFKHH